jgi:hypothetical protein
MADPRPIIKKFAVSEIFPSGLIADYHIEPDSFVHDPVEPKTIGQRNNITSEIIPGTSIPAMKFAGTSSSYVFVKNTNKLQLVKTTGSSFTVEAWIYATGIGQNPSGYGGMIVNKDSEFEFCRMGDGRIAVAIDWGIGTDTSLPSGGWIIPPSGTAVVPLNTPTHVAIVVDNTVLKIVINGSLAWQKTELNRVARTDATDFYIGNRSGKNQGFAGYIGSVRIWDYARSVSEINTSKDTIFGGVKGRYVATMPFDGLCTIHAWGGGGGAGGADAGTTGGTGATGLYNSTQFGFSKGDIIEVAVGEGGTGGASNSGAAPGGIGGRSRLNVNSSSIRSFNGGNGSASGPTPYSGGGGGGGGATVVLKNDTIVLVAAGGGGGGGAGNDGNSEAPTLRRNATIYKKTPPSNVTRITVQSSNWDVTHDKNTTWIEVNGKRIIDGLGRGHTLAVINPNTLALESQHTSGGYDASSSTELKNALNAVPNGRIVAIGSFDVCTLDQSTRDLLNSQFGGTRSETIRQIPRTAHVFIGIKNAAVAAVENISTTAIISETFTFNNSVDLTTIDCRGESAQTKTGDGGGAGGGGGGFPGAPGGAVFGGDASGYSGLIGSNYPFGDSFYESEPLVARSDSRWSAFQNKYAVWPTGGNDTGSFVIYRTFDAPYTGNYNIRASVDNNASIYVDDNLIGSAVSFNQTPNVVTISLSRGVHRLKIVATNAGDVAGFAMTISDSKDSVVWDTRTYMNPRSPGGESNYRAKGKAEGGIPNGGDGKDGYAVLVIQPYAASVAASAVKVGSSWRQVKQGYVKVSGEWKPIDMAYTKVNGTWRKITSTGDASEVVFVGQSTNYGLNTKNFS